MTKGLGAFSDVGRSMAACFLGASIVLGGCAKQSQPSGQAIVTGRDGFEVPRAELDQALASAGPAADQSNVRALVLAQVVDLELFAREARREKLDRDVAVVQAVEAAKRQILARAYADRLVGGLSPPTQAEVAAFYTSHPELFSERKIISLDEITVDGAPAKIAAVKAQFSKDASLPDLQADLMRQGEAASIAHVRLASEYMGLDLAGQLSRLKVGDTTIYSSPQGVHFAVVTAVTPAPLTQAQAASGIRALIQDQAKRALVNKEGERLKAAADLKYAKDFAPAKATGG